MTDFGTSSGEAYGSLITVSETLSNPWSLLTATIILIKLRVIPIVMCGCTESTFELSLEHATVYFKAENAGTYFLSLRQQ
jgi:hypothetical protein